MKDLYNNPHPGFKIYPQQANILFWKLILTGPEHTPYEDGIWLIYLDIPDEYPNIPPIMRMITKIRHVNINCHGRICHSIFDRNWLSTSNIRNVLNCVYGLLLTPDMTDPLDSVIALD